MAPDLSRISSVTRFPRVLLVENNFSIVEPLIRTFGDRRLDFDFDVCTSVGNAAKKLLASPYQLVISGTHLAEINDFLLLKHTHSINTFLPLVITAGTSEKKSARRALAKGAFDLIVTPLDHEQTVSTIRRALWQSKLMTLIACKEKAVEKYRDHIAAYPSGSEMDTILKRLFRRLRSQLFLTNRAF